jgi:16S rRNA (cytidine1402-2'-O)-methyltransferase
MRVEPGTMLFYEAPDRVAGTMADMVDAFGATRLACLSREITKRYEEHIRDTLAALASRFAEVSPRGECVIVIAGAPPGHADAETAVDLEDRLRALLESGLGPKDAAARLVVVTGKPRRHLYQLALAIQRDSKRPTNR